MTFKLSKIAGPLKVSLFRGISAVAAYYVVALVLSMVLSGTPSANHTIAIFFFLFFFLANFYHRIKKATKPE